MNQTKDDQLNRMVEIVDTYRSIVLDIAEQELGTNPNWQFIRNRLLKAFGDRGMSGKLREIFGGAA